MSILEADLMCTDGILNWRFKHTIIVTQRSIKYEFFALVLVVYGMICVATSKSLLQKYWPCAT